MANFTWKLTGNGDFADPANWNEGSLPMIGDSAVIDTSALPSNSTADVATFLTNEMLSGVAVAYRWTYDSQGEANIPSAYLINAAIGPGTTVSISSTNPDPNPGLELLSPGFHLTLSGNALNAGTIAIGSPASGSGTKVTSYLFLAVGSNGLFANTGLVTVGYGATYDIDPSATGAEFHNTATGTISVGGLSTLDIGNPAVGIDALTGSQLFANDGLLSVQGAAGGTTKAVIDVPIQGAGTMIADGGDNPDYTQTGLVFGNTVSGANVELQRHAEVQYNTFIGTHDVSGGSLTFEDGTTTLFTSPGGTSSTASGPPIYGFRAGDVIGLEIGIGGLDLTNATGVSWDQGSHVLSVMSGSTVVYAFILMGTYGQGDFTFAHNDGGTVIGTTSNANAAYVASTDAAGDTVLDVATGGPITTAGGAATRVNLGIAYSTVTSQGHDTIIGGSGALNVLASGAATTVFGGAGRLVYQGGNGNGVIATGSGGGTITTGSGQNQVLLAGGANLVNAHGQDTVAASTGADTVFANAGVLAYGGNGGQLNFIGGGQASTVVGGGGSVTVYGGSGNGGVVYGGTGATELVGGAGTSTFVGGQGTAMIYGGSGNGDVVYAGGGPTEFVGGAGSGTFVGGGGGATVYGGSGNGGVVYAGAGATEFVGGAGAGTFVGGNTAVLVFGGAGGGTIFGGSGGGQFFGANAATVIEVGTGASTVTASDGNAVFLTGSANNLIAAGGGNVTLVGGTSGGNNTIFAGSGADQLGGGLGNDDFLAGNGRATLSGGGGANLYSFVNGQAGGADVITDFHRGTDRLSLQGYGGAAASQALAGAVHSGGATVLSLADGTSVTLQNVAGLTAADFL